MTLAKPLLASQAPGGGAPGVEAGEPEEAAFEIRRGAELTTPLVFASPHSGRIYPPSLLSASVLDAHAIRKSEDAFVDQLIEGAFERGAAGVFCRTARVYLDVNRDPWELDPAMFAEPLPAFTRTQTARVAAGLGSIARVVGEGQEVYARKLTLAEATARIEQVHRPYHRALAGLIAEARAKFGLAVLIDWHSMPSAASRSGSRQGRAKPDVVLGDRHGASCGRGLTLTVRQALEKAGYAVALNVPYAGGFTTQTYGRPQDGVHALQVEIDRGLYLDEAKLEPSQGFGRVQRDLDRLFDGLGATEWVAALRR
jgi:N-formylglutamate amidohydrolase